MPRTKLDKDYDLKNFQEKIYGKMESLKVTLDDLAGPMGITKQALSKRIKYMHLTWNQLQIIFRKLEFTDEEILEIMREKK